ncbi:OmpA family protein, partial [Helicobacter rodentium]
FTIRPDMQTNVERDARILTSISAGTLSVRIEGNTDEWGTDEYNYALGLKRAVAVKNALVAQGVEEAKTTLVSYGESKPTCTAKTRECWAENRKVTFKMLP